MECFNVGIRQRPYRDCQISHWSKGVTGFTEAGILIVHKILMMMIYCTSSFSDVVVYMLPRMSFCWDINSDMKLFHVRFLISGWIECFNVGITRWPYRDCQISHWSKGVNGFTDAGILCIKSWWWWYILHQVLKIVNCCLYVTKHVLLLRRR